MNMPLNIIQICLHSFSLKQTNTHYLQQYECTNPKPMWFCDAMHACVIFPMIKTKCPPLFSLSYDSFSELRSLFVLNQYRHRLFESDNLKGGLIISLHRVTLYLYQIHCTASASAVLVTCEQCSLGIGVKKVSTCYLLYLPFMKA